MTQISHSLIFISINKRKVLKPSAAGSNTSACCQEEWSHGDSVALAKQIEGRQIVSGNKMPNIRAEVKINRYAECWWPLFLDSEIVWSTCQPQWTKQNRQCLETREGRVRAAQSSENCWHRRWQLVKVLNHLVWTTLEWCGGCSSEPKQKVDLRLDTGCGTGCDRAGQLVCGVWCCSQAAAIHFFIVRAGRVFALNWSDECAGDVMWVVNRARTFWHRCSIGRRANNLLLYTESSY